MRRRLLMRTVRVNLQRIIWCWSEFWIPKDKFELLALWIGLASSITVAAASVVYVKYRKKQQN